MSSAQSAIEKVRPGRLPQPLTSILAALLAVGVAAFAYGLSSDPQVTWLAFHTNFIYFAALSNGALILLCAFVIVGAKWPGPLRHIAEGLAAWVPISFLLGCVGYFGGDYLFEWLREGAVHGKEPWLNAPRFYITDLGVLAALGLLAMVFLKTTSRPLLGGGAADSMTGFAKRMADGWTTNWRGDREEIEEGRRCELEAEGEIGSRFETAEQQDKEGSVLAATSQVVGSTGQRQQGDKEDSVLAATPQVVGSTGQQV